MTRCECGVACLMRLSASISHPPSLRGGCLSRRIHHSTGRCRELGPSDTENPSGRPVFSSAAAGNDPERPIRFLQTGQSAKSRFWELECSEAAIGDLKLPARSRPS